MPAPATVHPAPARTARGYALTAERRALLAEFRHVAQGRGALWLRDVLDTVAPGDQARQSARCIHTDALRLLVSPLVEIKPSARTVRPAPADDPPVNTGTMHQALAGVAPPTEAEIATSIDAARVEFRVIALERGALWLRAVLEKHGAARLSALSMDALQAAIADPDAATTGG